MTVTTFGAWKEEDGTFLFPSRVTDSQLEAFQTGYAIAGGRDHTAPAELEGESCVILDEAFLPLMDRYVEAEDAEGAYYCLGFYVGSYCLARA